VAGPTRLDDVRLVYEEVHPRLWRALVAWTGSMDVADDAGAEAFAQLIRRGDAVRDPAAWVWRSAFRIAAGDLARRRAGGRRAGDEERLERLAGPVDRLPDDAVDLVRALATLTDQQRQCVALVYVADQSAVEAARVLGTSASTVRVQLLRSRRRLRALLANDEVTS